MSRIILFVPYSIRFIDENGKYHPHEKLVPFGIGKRSCPGKTLADTEVFLFLASFVQRFQFSFPKECDPPETIKPEVGFILVCPPYDIVINER
jgi:cytochrome P450 family 2 subfamily J